MGESNEGKVTQLTLVSWLIVTLAIVDCVCMCVVVLLVVLSLHFTLTETHCFRCVSLSLSLTHRVKGQQQKYTVQS